MSALTSLLVRDRIVPVSKIEQALHAQVFQGGDIEVILLEMGVVAEDVLSAYRAALFDLLPATRDEVMKASREVLRRVPAELARSLGIAPIFFEGRTLVVAGWEPLYEPRLSELEAQLGCDVTVRIVNQPRLASALSHHYGFELEPRLRRLSDSLRKRHPGVVPYVRPPAQSMRPLRRHEEEGDDDELEPAVVVRPPSPPEIAYAQVAQSLPVTPPPAGPPPAEVPFGEPSVEDPWPDEPREEESSAEQAFAEHALAEQALAEQALAEQALAEQALAEQALAEQAPAEQALAEHSFAAQSVSERPPVEQAPVEQAPVEQPADQLPAEEPAGQTPAEEPAEDDEAMLPTGVSPELAAIIRGPIDLERASELLQVTSKRDDVLFVLLRYAQYAFDFVCVYSVGKDGARARMAHGAGVTRDIVEHVMIPAPRDGVLAAAVHERRPVLGEFGLAPEEQTAALALHRERGRIGLFVPIVLNDRAVLVVHAERVRRGLGIGEASIVLALVPSVLAALRRLILAAKADRQRPSLSPPAPTLEIVQEEAALEAELPLLLTEPVVPPSFEQPAVDGSDMRAVDLDAFEQLASADAARESTERPSERVRETLDRGQRLAGVPRPPPPPPTYEAPVPAPANGGYRQRGGAGLAQERAVAQDRAPEQAHAAPVVDERSRLSLVEPTAAMPSVIIDMGENVDALIESLLRAPAGSDPPEVDELLQVGEGVLPVLTQHFPGPLWFDRNKPYKRRPRGRDVSPVARAVAAFGERAASYVAALLGPGDPDRTFYALMLASEIVHADLIDPVARRVLDKDDSLRLLAVEVLRHYAVLPHYDVVLGAISELTERPGKDPRRQRLAVEALAELRDSRSLRVLIARLGDRDEQVVQAAHRALVVLTGQDFGHAQRRWETWAEGWGRAHRVEWLIEALLHTEEPVRTMAGEELKLLTQQYFGYHPALPRKDRELAQRKYREWWELEGRVAFSG